MSLSLPLITWDISPIFFSLGGGFFSIRWYGVFFAAGVFVFASLIERSRALKENFPITGDQDLIIFSAIFSTLLGAKIGYVLLYTPQALWFKTLWTLQGFSFHGGLFGLLLYFVFLSLRYGVKCLLLMDRFSVIAPWSLALGRIGNFFNSELIGRPTNQNWGVLFPYAERHPVARHPSQLYESLGEGLFLGITLYFLDKWMPEKPWGMRASFFLILYGFMRLFLEQFREPDPQIGFIGNGWTMGQILCAIMIGAGLLLWISVKKNYIQSSQKDPL